MLNVENKKGNFKGTFCKMSDFWDLEAILHAEQILKEKF